MKPNGKMDSNNLKLLILLWVAVCGLWGLEANASLLPCQIPLNPSEIVLSREVVTTQNDLSHPDEVRTTMTVNGKTSKRRVYKQSVIHHCEFEHFGA
jgi:hypothetical protein